METERLVRITEQSLNEEENMNRITIIGNLTKDPELRTTPNGTSVCSFTVAVNRRKTQNNQNPEADFFNVNAWRELGESCAKFLQKGRKVAVVGAVSVSTYTSKDGKTYASMNVHAQDVEFLSPKDMVKQATEEMIATKDEQSGFTAVETEDLPF